MKDPRDPLSSTLQSWHHEPAPAPDFNNEVWARIRSANTNARADTGRSFASIFRFPSALPLAASIAVLFSIAAGTGTAVAFTRTRTTELMAAAYVRSIDPVQMTASAAHVHP